MYVCVYVLYGFIEAKLSKIAYESLLADIKEDTVDFQPNFDGSEEVSLNFIFLFFAIFMMSYFARLFISSGAVGLTCDYPHATFEWS